MGFLRLNARTRRISGAVLLVAGLAAGSRLLASSRNATAAADRAAQKEEPPPGKDPSQEKGERKKSPGVPARTNPPSPPAKHRWEFLEDHVYKWIHERREVGRTSFRLSRGKPGGSAAFEAEVQFSYENEATSIASRRRYTFDQTWRPITLDVETGVRTVKDITALLQASARRNGTELVTSTVMNGDRERASETTLEYARDAYVLWPQSVELWALYSPTLLPLAEKKKIRVLYPYFAKTYSVTISLQGEVEFRLGSETIPCRRYRFRSDDRQLDGEIWADATGRMLAYKQGKLTIRLEPRKGGGREK